MAFITDDWKSLLQEFSDSVEKSIDEIRECKAAVQSIKPGLVNEQIAGRYIRDEHRIILSAPEVIIGNVDKDGSLWALGSSSVVIRGNDVAVEASSGVAPGSGRIVNRASVIKNIAVDPGMDGKEDVLADTSIIVNQARAISIVSNSDKGVFLSPAPAADGITIHSDTDLTIDSTSSSEGRKKTIESRISELKETKSEQKSSVSKLKKSVDKLMKSLDDLLKEDDSRSGDIEDIRAEIGTLYERQSSFEQIVSILSREVVEYTRELSNLAETCRTINCLEDAKKEIPDGDKFKKESTGARLGLAAETVSIVSLDGDNNLRTNPGSGVKIQANTISFNSVDSTGALMEKGAVSMNAKDISISTASTKFKDLEKRDSADMTAEGNLTVNSKTVTLTAVDSEFKDKKITEKALTKDGRLDIRFERTSVSATDTEGKATGSISLNAKDVEIKSFDVKKDDRSDDKLASGSSLLLTSEKVFTGSRDKNNKTKQLQIVADKTGIFGDTTAEVQQGEGKAVVQLDGGNLSMSGSKTNVFGAATVNGKTDFKADITAPKATIDNIQAKSSFKSTNISDGIAVPASPSTAKLSAKLKVEEKKAQGGK